MFLGLVLLPDPAFAQITIYVDSTATNPTATGSSADPYRSLSFAIGQNPLQLVPGSLIKVAGNGPLATYTDLPGTSGWSDEAFPIKVPEGVRVDYWDKNGLLPGQRPPTAVFTRGVSLASDCFQFFGGGTNIPQGINAYLATTITPTPNLNQGFEVRDFELAYKIQESAFPPVLVLKVILDGVSAYECHQAAAIAINYLSADITVKRSVFRSPSGAFFQPDKQVVEIVSDTSAAGGPQSPKVSLIHVDMRPQGTDLRSTMLTIQNGGDAEDYLIFTLNNSHISGQPFVQQIPPSPLHKIQGACVENAWVGDARGRTTIQNTVLWDAEGDGVFAFIRGGGNAEAEIEFLSCDAAYNGAASPPIGPVLSPTTLFTFSGSGIHLAALEKGNWQDVEFRETEARDNYNHGAYLELVSFPDENDAFQNVDVDFCNFSRNGLVLDSSVEGQGFYVRLQEAEINLEMHRSLLARNHTTGLKFYLVSGDTARHHQIAVTNTVISANEGKAPLESTFIPYFPNRDEIPRHISPLTVMSENQTHYATVNLSHVTFTDCVTPYAVSMLQMDDPSLGLITLLWSDASSVDNSVLKKNRWINGADIEDQAFYPEPPHPDLPPPDHLWLRMFESTSYSNLGTDFPPFGFRYTPVRNNFYTDPSLTAFTWMNTLLGKVFPSAASPLIDIGGGTVFASETTDVRGPGYPRVVDFGLNGSPVRDVGAFELQN